MYLIQLLLPLNDNDGQRLPGALFQEVREELVARFGGLTAFSRAPVEGLCQDEAERVEDDELLVYEVMTEALDRAWWADYRRRLEAAFRQREILIRAQPTERL
ncbi:MULTISPECIES: hypothetical protein [Pseudomonadaceae]|jgi:hypothetical protein|uniref:Uncharacterized protein n=1 Tax=Ectopseudomonas oleovorans TaxID=301 RepID=A0A3D9EUI3_ECTOL|nr:MULTISPECIES: hypothetical protein [Pseudomonas]KIZ50290.1 hypothetical protein UM91_12475 [Pseudomonas oryzihabitans]MBA1257434.1 hypothetical protein [Pseudomonas psychrotolerans]MBH3331374.1 hypothetical protein [Pseudomonas oryzihabitans]QEU03510.1 hypothetical protein FOB65_09420 [Pseudomonas oryzihabitans]RAU35094.1 hypothetical protein DBY63_019860 [Pseudomonas sp. RIT 411]